MPRQWGAHLSVDSGFPLSDFHAHKDALKKLSMTTAMINEPDTRASSRLNAQMPVSTSCPPDVGNCSAFVGNGDFMNAQKGNSTTDAQLGGSPGILSHSPQSESRPKRSKRSFTNQEKAIINYKRKVGVCKGCRQPNRTVCAQGNESINELKHRH